MFAIFNVSLQTRRGKSCLVKVTQSHKTFCICIFLTVYDDYKFVTKQDLESLGNISHSLTSKCLH